MTMKGFDGTVDWILGTHHWLVSAHLIYPPGHKGAAQGNDFTFCPLSQKHGVSHGSQTWIILFGKDIEWCLIFGMVTNLFFILDNVF